MAEQAREAAECKFTLKTEAENFEGQNALKKEQIASLRVREAEYIEAVKEKEFTNHLISESPFSILAVRDTASCESLGLRMHNGSYDIVNFELLH